MIKSIVWNLSIVCDVRDVSHICAVILRVYIASLANKLERNMSFGLS